MKRIFPGKRILDCKYMFSMATHFTILESGGVPIKSFISKLLLIIEH